MTSASDKELSALHATLSKTLAKQLSASNQAELLLIEFPDLPDEVKDFLEKHVDASPALLTVTAKFLKDNNITCQVEEDEHMSELAQRLKNKKGRKQVGNVIAFPDEE